jgi:hypothetical protein
MTMALLAALFNTCAVFAYANASREREARRLTKIKDAIQKLGTGKEARVRLTLTDETKLEGYVSEAGEESFVVMNSETGTGTTVACPQVGKVRGHNLSTGAKIGIGVGIGIAVVAIVIVLARNSIQDSLNGR